LRRFPERQNQSTEEQLYAGRRQVLSLTQSRIIRILGEDTDLLLSVEGKKWINCSGKLNMPDGEAYTGSIENSANGAVRFTYPGILAGREIEDIRLVFKDGEIVEAKTAKGDELLQQIIEVDG